MKTDIRLGFNGTPVFFKIDQVPMSLTTTINDQPLRRKGREIKLVSVGRITDEHGQVKTFHPSPRKQSLSQRWEKLPNGQKLLWFLAIWSILTSMAVLPILSRFTK